MTGVIWLMFGFAGQLVFQGRFYVQWIASELAGRSVMPVSFWYMSGAGSLMLFIYAFHIQSPIGALGQCLTIVIASRNLIHIWRGQSGDPSRRYLRVHVAVGAIAVLALGLAGYVWFREYAITQAQSPDAAREVWFWLAVGLVGQSLFATRFLVQWIATERRRECVVPVAFWYLSIAASVLLFGSYAQRQEWIFALGMIIGTLIYLRNLWFIHRGGETEMTVAGERAGG